MTSVSPESPDAVSAAAADHGTAAVVAGSTRAVERALALLAQVCERESTSLAEAARRTKLAPSTALRLLRTLEHGGFIARDATGSWTPGQRMIALGATVIGRESLIRLARPSLQRIVDVTGETAYLIVGDGAHSALYVGMVEGVRSVRHTSWVGRSIDVSGLAVGRALVGEVPTSGPDRGFVAERDRIEPDVTAIAAPIRRPGGIAGALNLLGPTYRIDDTAMREYGRVVAAEADTVSRLLGAAAVPNPATTTTTNRADPPNDDSTKNGRPRRTTPHHDRTDVA